MLRAGYFENLRGANTLLIWGDEQGLGRLQQLLVRLSSGTRTSAAIQEIEEVHIGPSLRIMFEAGPNELRVHRSVADIAIVASCSADLLAAFADKVARLADPKRRAGHQYLEWPGAASIVVMVSKGEYPTDFGDA